MNTTFDVFLKLLACESCQTKDLAADLNLNIRKIQRIIQDIKLVFDKNPTMGKYFKFEQTGYSYSIKQRYLLDKDQVLLLAKILVASRSLNPTELPRLTNQMLDMLNIEERDLVSSSIMSERITDNYIDNESYRIKKIGQLEEYIFNHDRIRFTYVDHEAFENTRTETIEMLPVHTFFDNYYFFIIGFVKATGKNRIFRIDWMSKIEKISVSLHIDHKAHHDHGEETRYEAYGYLGEEEKTRIQFEYYGYIEYVKDRFPTCKIIKKVDKPNRFPFSVYILEIEVNYSDGVKLWLLGETTILRVISPSYIAHDIRDTLREGYERYLED